MIIRLLRDLFGRITEYRETEEEKNISQRRNNKLAPVKEKSSEPEFRFSRSYLMDFSDSREPLIYNNRKIYTLGRKEKDSSKGVIYRGKRCKLEELEDISELERQMIGINQSGIEDFQRKALSFYAKQQDSKNSEVLALAVDNSSLDSFITNYLIPTHIKNLNQSNNPKTNIPKIDTGKITLKPAGLSKRMSALEMFVSSLKCRASYGLALMNGSVYLFRDNLDNAKTYKTTKEFESGYLKKLSDEITNGVKKDIFSCIKKVSPSFSKIKSSQTPQQVPSSIRGLYFDKNSSHEYVVYIETGEYTIEHKHDYYNFGSTKVGITLTQTKGGLTFTERPFIYNHSTYKHPLVFGSSKFKQICFGIANDASYRNKRWGITSKTKSPERLAYGILETLRRGKNILACGYTNNNTNRTYYPVEDCGKKVSYATAKNLETKGVPICYG